MSGAIILGAILQDQTLSLVSLLMLLRFLFLNYSAFLQSLDSYFSDCGFQTSNSQKGIFFIPTASTWERCSPDLVLAGRLLPKICPSFNSELLPPQVLTGIRKWSLATRTICAVKHIFSLQSPRNCEKNWTTKQMLKKKKTTHHDWLLRYN